MTITVQPRRTKTIYKGQPEFNIVDGMVVHPRASVQILPECPHAVRDQINWALAKGWLQPVATVYDHELVWENLSKPAD